MAVYWSRFGNKHLIEVQGRQYRSPGDSLGHVASLYELIDMGFAILVNRQRAANYYPHLTNEIRALRDRYGMTQTSINTLIVVSSAQRQAMERRIDTLVGGGDHDVTINLSNAALFTVSNGNGDDWQVGTRGGVTFTVNVSGTRKTVVHLKSTNIIDYLHRAGDARARISDNALKQLTPMSFRPTVEELGTARARLKPVTPRPPPMRENYLGKFFPVSFFDPTPPVIDKVPSTFSAPPGRSQAEQLMRAMRATFDIDDDTDEDESED